MHMLYYYDFCVYSRASLFMYKKIFNNTCSALIFVVYITEVCVCVEFMILYYGCNLLRRNIKPAHYLMINSYLCILKCLFIVFLFLNQSYLFHISLCSYFQDDCKSIMIIICIYSLHICRRILSTFTLFYLFILITLSH